MAAAIVAVFLQGGTSQAQTVHGKPSLSTLVAEAKQLSNQVDSLGQQYDALKIEIVDAKSTERQAKLAATRAQAAMSGSEQAVAQLAAMGYMNGGLDPTLEMLTNADPARFLSQASTMEALDNEAGLRLTTLQRDQLTAARAQVTAQEEIATVDELEHQLTAKVGQIQSKLALLNSSEMAQALAVLDKTGKYPDIVPPVGNTIGDIALRAALTRQGDPYVWAMAGPDEFDCSGLVVWAFAQEGITLPHYTGSLWDEGEPVSRNDLEPGDLLFFFADISHVAIYLGTVNGVAYMVAAPSAGENVQVQPVFWYAFVGARRIT